MEVICDECGQGFELKLKEKDVKDGYKFRYFDCPHCKYRYKVLKHKPKNNK